MRIAIATPVRPGSISGNSVTAERWARRLGELGHQVTVHQVSEGVASDELWLADMLVALHARRCAPVIARWHARRPEQPLVVGLTGTDLYKDLPDDQQALASLQAATRLTVLQPLAIDRLAGIDPAFATKTTVTYQSVEPPLPPRATVPGVLRVVVLAHLRDVKDPLLVAAAARRLPETSRVVIDHAGAAHNEQWRRLAEEETGANPRYRWHGELARPDALSLLATADLLACTSRLEGGANAVTEAIAQGVPVVGTRIDGNLGLLGRDYPGLVDLGDAPALADLLDKIEHDPPMLADLHARIEARRHITDPATERAAWAEVLAHL